MKRRRNSFVPYLSIALILSGGLAFALSRIKKPTPPPRQTGIAFAKALGKNDQAAIRALAFGSEAQFGFVAGFSNWTVSYAKYETAFANAFPAEKNQPFLENSGKMIAQIEAADQKIEGDNATIASPKNGSLVLKFHKTQGQWKLDLSSLCADAQAAAQGKKLRRMADAYDGSRKDLEAGKVKNADQAQRELKGRIDGVLFLGYQYESQGKPVGPPTTQPLPTTQRVASELP